MVCRARKKMSTLYPLFAALCLFLVSPRSAALSCCRKLIISERLSISCFGNPNDDTCYGGNNSQARRETCYRWRRNDEVLNFTVPELEIREATSPAALTDYGVYSCGSCDDNKELFTTTTVYPAQSCLNGKLMHDHRVLATVCSKLLATILS